MQRNEQAEFFLRQTFVSTCCNFPQLELPIGSTGREITTRGTEATRDNLPVVSILGGETEWRREDTMRAFRQTYEFVTRFNGKNGRKATRHVLHHVIIIRIALSLFGETPTKISKLESKKKCATGDRLP